jgi:hypothetical protein
MDSSSELNKRLLNGESVKSLLGAGLESLDPKSQSFISVLFLLEEEKLKKLLEWIISMSDKERLNVLETFQSLSPEDMAKLSELSPEMKDLFFRAFKEPKKPNPLRGFTKPFKERMVSYLEKKGG